MIERPPNRMTKSLGDVVSGLASSLCSGRGGTVLVLVPACVAASALELVLVLVLVLALVHELRVPRVLLTGHADSCRRARAVSVKAVLMVKEGLCMMRQRWMAMPVLLLGVGLG